jgi:hypothetical protein
MVPAPAFPPAQLVHVLILLLHHVAPLASDLSLALSGLVMHHSSQSIMMLHHNQHLNLNLNLHTLTRSPIRKSQMMNKQLRLRTMFGVQSWKQLASTLNLWRWGLMMCMSLLFLQPNSPSRPLVSLQCQNTVYFILPST